MRLRTFGNPRNPAVLFFHAMGVTGDSSKTVVNYLQECHPSSESERYL